MARRRIATLEDMERIARSYDTLMSLAMLRALGVPLLASKRARVRASKPESTYDGMADCFENRRAVRL